jgi:hypothetical protein
MIDNRDSRGPVPESRNILIKVEPAIVNISPLGFHRYSSEFYDAAKSLETTESYSPVPYYLYCHSLELALKAYLLAKGTSKGSLKNKYGHDLEKSLHQAESFGLGNEFPLSSKERAHIALANAHYKKKGFEYFDVSALVSGLKGQRKLPELEVLDSLIESLLNGIKQTCLEA